MYTRDYKNSAPGQYYHIYNRGNAKGVVFQGAEDYQFFLLRLQQNLKPRGNEGRWFRSLPQGTFTLIAYCLMPNHFHLLIRQNNETSTSKLLGKVCTSYSKYFNKKYQRVGHMFQDQFKQKEVSDNRYLLWLSAYIHLNPVEAGIVADANRYPWSSLVFYTSRVHSDFVEPAIVLDQLPGSYSEFLAEARLAQEYRAVSTEVAM